MASEPLASIPFLCIWAKKKPGDNADQYLAACKQFFDSHKGTATVTFRHPVQVLTRDCEDTLWQLQCELNLASPLEAPQVESLSADIARQWCTLDVNNSALSDFLLWLMPDCRLGFRKDFLTLQQEVKLRSVSFGTFVGLNVFAKRHTIVAKTTKTTNAGYDLDCTFKHDERHLQVFLGLFHCVAKRELYRLDVDYGSIVRVVVHDPVGGPTDAFLHLRTLPLFNRDIDGAYFFASFPEDQRQKTRDEMDFQRTLKVGCSCTSVLESRDVGGCWVLKLSFADSGEAHLAISRMSRRCEATQFVYAPVRTTLVESSSVETLRQRVRSRLVPQLRFRCSYALNALLENSDDALVQMGLMSSEVQDIALRYLESLAQRSVDALEQAMFAVGRALDRRAVVSFATALPLAFQRMLQETSLPRAIPHNSCLIRRLVVTPSRVFYLPPAIHSENRVLRKFDASCALRVSFRDDNFAPLSDTLRFHPEKKSLVDEVVGRFLREGIWIGELHFRLLAGSEAGIRNHEMWLYANDPKGKTVDTVRPWMGDLNGQPSLTGKMALMAHCLTTTQQSTTVPLHNTTTTEQSTSVTLSEKVLEKVADIEGGTRPDSGKPFVFSEGIGMISPSLMREVCTDLNMVQMPSAIQICYAGYAGVVCVNDTLAGDKLVVRKSMYKFNCSKSESIEVVKVSAPTPVFLNRPLITILEQLGVPRQVFLRLQQKMVLQLCDAFVDDLTALRVLCTYGNASLPFSKLHVHGLSLSQEPLTRSLLLAVYKSLIAGLQEESRVAVPPDGGRSMMGVLDETGTLEYGQVFVQYTQLGVNRNSIAAGGAEDDAPVTEVLTGTVLVTKEACFHPGDVRKFEAVDVPALHHIKDCIVFPSKGPRPHPNEIGSSGLGGDEYIVIWEKNLLFPGDNREPRAPRRASRMLPSTGVLNEDIIQFLCCYILNDSVGVMSNAYLVFADTSQLGISQLRCLSLAEKISINLDSAKTGVFAKLARREMPKKYPDWLRGKYGLQPTRRSVRALGELQRLNRPIPCHGVTLAFKTEDFHCGLFEYTGWVHHVESAREAMSVYAWNVSQILSQHGIESEAEVITGLISSVSRYEHGRNKAGTLAVAQYRTLAELMQARFVANVDVAASRQDGQIGRVLLEMASAWYMVAYMGTLKGEKNVLGFPWCIADNLLQLLREHSGGFPVPRLSSPLNVLATKINSRGTKGLVEDKAFDMLSAWARREGLLRDASKPWLICESCLKRAFSEFASSRQAGQEPTIGGPWDDPCRAVTTGEYVCDFLRQLTAASPELPACSRCRCKVRQSRLPRLAALIRYPRLVMSRDLGCFDLPSDPSLCDGAEELCESQPLRIDVTNSAFLGMVVGRPDVVRDLLCRWTKVEEVSIRWHTFRSSKFYVVMSAVGRPWALCYFDEILVQSWFEEAIVVGRLA